MSKHSKTGNAVEEINAILADGKSRSKLELIETLAEKGIEARFVQRAITALKETGKVTTRVTQVIYPRMQ